MISNLEKGLLFDYFAEKYFNEYIDLFFPTPNADKTKRQNWYYNPRDYKDESEFKFHPVVMRNGEVKKFANFNKVSSWVYYSSGFTNKLSYFIQKHKEKIFVPLGYTKVFEDLDSDVLVAARMLKMPNYCNLRQSLSLYSPRCVHALLLHLDTLPGRFYRNLFDFGQLSVEELTILTESLSNLDYNDYALGEQATLEHLSD